MSMTETLLPKSYHAAVERWRDLYLPDHAFLEASWEKHFPREPRPKLCALRECGMCGVVECGERKGEAKYTRVAEMPEEQARHLFAMIRAQASTEFGSIQQHQLTLSRARDEEEQVWVLRMMADELRHGYQMLHLLVEDDWSAATGRGATDLVEEILSIRTGDHVLGAFNIDFDSFVDNIVFCALIDRVGKFQLAMQRVSAYSPMAESMPQMLREEAFHLAAGVVPMRRWVERAARGSVEIGLGMLQKVLAKWVPRGLEMFGDERGGGSNVRWGLKPAKNAEAQEAYYLELGKVVRDLNLRYLRARLPGLSLADAEALLARLEEGRGSERGIRFDELLRLPHREFFRRRGVPAFRMVGLDGEPYTDRDEYVRHLARVLPESYLAGRDFHDYLQQLDRVVRGELEPGKAAAQSPSLRRVGGVCPCSRAVRWVVDEPAPSSGTMAV
jgi:1,2-phenylacetyl-CoA epoxidase catalytic subunit